MGSPESTQGEPIRRMYCTYCDDYGHDYQTHVEQDGPLCQCGHFRGDHHTSYFFGESEFAGQVWAEECEFYGFNETGGAMKNAEGKWVEHCNHFREVKPQ